MDEAFQSNGSRRHESRRPHEARRAVVASTRRCMHLATRQSITDDASTLDRYASDDTFRELHKCVAAFAHVMRTLGVPQRTSENMLMSALADAADSGEPHPALVAAIEEWFRDAFNGPGHKP